MIKITSEQLGEMDEGCELWLSRNRIYHFDTVKEAYLYYLDHFATEKDFKWCESCGTSREKMRTFADDPQLVQCQFDNVFNERHHIYIVKFREDGQLVRVPVYEWR